MGFYGDGGDGRGGSRKTRRLFNHVQNPAQTKTETSTWFARRDQLVETILDVFADALPSNYASHVRGPFYSHMFRVMAEGLAEIQLEAELIVEESIDLGLVRSDFIYQLLGKLVFPNTNKADLLIDGDVSMRTFLQSMVDLLLEGARKDPIQTAANLLGDASVEIVPKSDHQSATSAWGLGDQFEFEVNVIAHKSTEGDSQDHWHRVLVDSQGDGRTIGTFFNRAERMEVHTHDVRGFAVQRYTEGTGQSHDHQCFQRFPEDPFILQHNIQLVLAALKPAHTLYEYRHLFVEGFGELFQDDFIMEHESWRYEDLRKNWRGNKALRGNGDTGSSDRSLLIDSDQDFSRVPPYAVVRIAEGANEGTYQAVEALPLPVMSDGVARPYYTSPSGVSGDATVTNGEVEDTEADFSVLVSGEKLVFTEGPNTGTYRVASLLGSHGGPVGKTEGPATRLRLAHSLLRMRPRMTYVVEEQSYQVGLDRLGESEPTFVVGEDSTSQFIL